MHNCSWNGEAVGMKVEEGSKGICVDSDSVGTCVDFGSVGTTPVGIDGNKEEGILEGYISSF